MHGRLRSHPQLPQPTLPFSGKTPRSRQNSYRAAVSAARTRQRKAAQYLAWLREVGKATDWGTVDHFRWPMSTVCSVRNGLVDKGLVTAIGDCIGRYGKRITLWGPKAA